MIAASTSRVTEPSAPSFSAEKQRVARRSMAAAAAMTLLKVAAGLLSGSLGVFPTLRIRGSTWWAPR